MAPVRVRGTVRLGPRAWDGRRARRRRRQRRVPRPPHGLGVVGRRREPTPPAARSPGTSSTGVHDSPRDSERTVWSTASRARSARSPSPRTCSSVDVRRGRRARLPRGVPARPRRQPSDHPQPLRPAVRDVHGHPPRRRGARRGLRGDGAPRRPLVGAGRRLPTGFRGPRSTVDSRPVLVARSLGRLVATRLGLVGPLAHVRRCRPGIIRERRDPSRGTRDLASERASAQPLGITLAKRRPHP